MNHVFIDYMQIVVKKPITWNTLLSKFTIGYIIFASAYICVIDYLNTKNKMHFRWSESQQARNIDGTARK
jgi:hypothetical protein